VPRNKRAIPLSRITFSHASSSPHIPYFLRKGNRDSKDAGTHQDLQNIVDTQLYFQGDIYALHFFSLIVLYNQDFVELSFDSSYF
jgi:hypothetical protein